MLRRTAIKAMLALSCLLPLMAMSGVRGYAGEESDGIDDAAIIAIYNQVNSFDIETALVGQVRGHSSDVQALAEMVSNDHTGVRAAVHDLAATIGVVPDLPAARADAAKAHYIVIADLRARSGADFDRTYLLHEIEFHTVAIEAVKEVLLPAANHAELKAHFEAVLPHFERHLDETVRLAEKLGVK